MKYGLFLGCNMPALRPDVERAIRLTMPALGVELVDLEGYVCCPAFGTFPSLDEDAQLAVSAWNLSIGEAKGLDLMVECGSCYSSLRSGRRLLLEHPDKRQRVNALLHDAGKSYQGENTVKHITDVLYREVGTKHIAKSVSRPLEGLKIAVQYPCHTLFPSEVVGFEDCSVQPKALGQLVEALGAEVPHFSREYECCGGAGGFHVASKAEGLAYTGRKLDAIVQETRAHAIVVSCITCLMHLDNSQAELNRNNGDGRYALPVFDYNQLLALAMGYPASEVAAISTVPRESVLAQLPSAQA